MLLIIILSFFFSFIFAIGGVGAAVVLVPILFWLGIPLNQAKPTGLFLNTVSLTGASISNIKEKRLDFKTGIPIIIFSFLFAPLGAYFSHIIPQKIVLIIFVLFLIFSSFVMFFFKSSKYSENFRDDRPFISLSILGIVVGLISGLLGVGGGGLISPVMVIMGFNPKKVATITAFVVPFSSLSGFLTYLSMGSVNIKLLIFAAGAAFIGGYLGTKFMQNRLKPATVKKILAFILLVLAVKLVMKLF
jgi:uncharacterized membrane protein YfcA